MAPSLPLGRERATVDHLIGRHLILREPGASTRQSTECLSAALGYQVEPRMKMASNEAIACSEACGVGVSMLPRVVVGEMLALNAVREIKLHVAINLARSPKLLQLHSRVPSPAAVCMLSLLRDASVSRDGPAQSWRLPPCVE